jgi:Uma2 family endonuclease
MRAVWVEVPQHVLDERRRLGLDHRDEVWEGTLHMVPPASSSHGEVQAGLAWALTAAARARGWKVLNEPGVFDPGWPDDGNYRVPDVVVADPVRIEHKGVIARAEIAIEVRSPNDESYDKLPFYEAMGCQEVWIVHPDDRRAEVWHLVDGRLVETDGTRSTVLDARLATIDVGAEPRLRITVDGETFDV